MGQEIDERLKLANRAIQASGDVIRKYFLTGDLQVRRKGDGSPLTIADQETEEFLRGEIKKAFPEDGIVGEEFGETEGTSGFRWILDPIDGTKSFISGVPLFGTMIGVEVDGRSIIGSVYFPGLNEGIYAAQGQGAWHYRNDQPPTRASVSKTTTLSDAVLVTSEVESFHDRNAQEIYRELAQAVFFARTWGDVYGYMLVATGRVDVMIDPILNIWDAAAVQPIIEEAGGVFSDWAGLSRIDAGESVGTNGLLHEQVLDFTRCAAGSF